MHNHFWQGRDSPARPTPKPRRLHEGTCLGRPTLTASLPSPAPPHHCSAAINHREALEFRAGFCKRKPRVQEPRCRLTFFFASALGCRAQSRSLLCTPSEHRGSPSPKHGCFSTPSAPFPQHWITQLEIMLLPVPSKPTGASAKVNTSSSQFH